MYQIRSKKAFIPLSKEEKKTFGKVSKPIKIKIFKAYASNFECKSNSFGACSEDDFRETSFSRLFSVNLKLNLFFCLWNQNFWCKRTFSNGVEDKVCEHERFLRILFHLEPWHCLQFTKACKKAFIKNERSKKKNIYSEFTWTVIDKWTFQISSCLVIEIFIVQKEKRRIILPPETVFIIILYRKRKKFVVLSAFYKSPVTKSAVEKMLAMRHYPSVLGSYFYGNYGNELNQSDKNFWYGNERYVVPELSPRRLILLFPLLFKHENIFLEWNFYRFVIVGLKNLFEILFLCVIFHLGVVRGWCHVKGISWGVIGEIFCFYL